MPSSPQGEERRLCGVGKRRRGGHSEAIIGIGGADLHFVPETLPKGVSLHGGQLKDRNRHVTELDAEIAARASGVITLDGTGARRRFLRAEHLRRTSMG